jgi:FkbM family methyltransferase
MAKTAFLLGQRLSLSGDPSDAYYRDIAEGGNLTDNTHLCASRLVSGRSFTCLDVGANIGVFTLALARLCPGGRIFAFEPSPSTFRFLSENINSHACTTVVAVPLALADHDGKVLFHDVSFFEAGSFTVPDGSPLTSEVIGSDLRSVACEKLDTFVQRAGLKRVDFIKIDVEGSELSVLEGAGETLTHFHPLVMLEFNSFALSVFRDITASRFLRTLKEIFPRLFLIGRTDGHLSPLKTEKDFYLLLQENLTKGCVDNLLGAWHDSALENDW